MSFSSYDRIALECPCSLRAWSGAQKAHPAEVRAISSVVERLSKLPQCGCAKCKENDSQQQQQQQLMPIQEPSASSSSSDEKMWSELFRDMRKLASCKACIQFHVLYSVFCIVSFVYIVS